MYLYSGHVYTCVTEHFSRGILKEVVTPNKKQREHLGGDENLSYCIKFCCMNFFVLGQLLYRVSECNL